MRTGSDLRYGYVTSEEVPVRGEIKVVPEDFRVEEIPAYAPSGTGSHVFFLVEKRGIATFEAIRRLARALERNEEEFGYAGLKDARAVTRQIVSIENEPPERILSLDLPDLRIEWAERHGHKLRIGHLRGNRFTIRVRRTRHADLSRVRRVLERLSRVGVPNYYGPQRFGVDGRGVELGRDLVRRDRKAFLDRFLGSAEPGDPALLATARARYRHGDFEGAAECAPSRSGDVARALQALAGSGGDVDVGVEAVSLRMRQLFVSSFQAHLFNRVLSKRIDTLCSVEEGDVAFVHESGACFVVEDAASERGRAGSFEISPSGPIVGWKLLRGFGRPRAIEDEVFEGEGVRPESFRDLGLGLHQKGIRRSLRIRLEEARADWWEGVLILAFALPKGSYATTVVEEILKTRWNGGDRRGTGT